MMFGKMLDLDAELKKLANPNLTLEQLDNMIIYLNKEYSEEEQLTDDFSVYMDSKSYELYMARQNVWGRLLDFLRKRQDEIVAQSEYFDECQNRYYS